MPGSLSSFRKKLLWSSVAAVSLSAVAFGFSQNTPSVSLTPESSEESVSAAAENVSSAANVSSTENSRLDLGSVDLENDGQQQNSKQYSKLQANELPASWPSEVREYVSNFSHVKSDYWQKQVAAHEAQPRTEGWVKYELYAMQHRRDVLALPTFKQMAESPRSQTKIIVKLKPDTDPDTMREFELDHDVKLGGQLISDLHRFGKDSIGDFEELIEAVNAHPDVIYAEPDYALEKALVPNDPNITPSDWWLDQINAYEAWDESTDATAIGPIAVFDNGILVTHEDLADNLWVNAEEIAGNGIDDDGNGFIDDINGITVSAGSMGHGTPVAGTICGQGDNAIGYVGSAWDCQLMELRSGLTFSGTVGDLAIALPYAIGEGSRISNHSWRIFTFSQMLADTVDAAETSGHLLVAAAGNENNDIDAEVVNYPARLPNDNVLTIAASTTDESRISYSSWGSVSVDLAAPTEFVTANSSGSYSGFSGTSQATPVVTGAVALAWSQAPNLSYLEIKQLVMDSARPVSSWTGLTVTGGILDMEALMLSIDPDTDGDGLVDSIDPDDDNDGVLDENDAFPRDPTESVDSDGDGVGDNSDVFPSDPAEWLDTDGDGVGDNGDAFPNDPTETVDSDGDGVGDNSDVFPTDPAESSDFDGDGVGDNGDVDSDNDGIANVAEDAAVSGAPITIAPDQVLSDGGTATQLVDLSSMGARVGGLVRINTIIARGDLDSSSENFTLSFNAGEFTTPTLTTGVQCSATLDAVTTAVDQVVQVIDIGAGVPGIEIEADVSSSVNSICSGFALEYQLNVTNELITNADNDAFANFIDRDSDNDGLPDIIEAGLTDVDGDYQIDSPADEGSVSPAPDTDADGLPDHLDLESTNPLNDGTAFDIFAAGYAAIDSNGDGMVDSTDVGGGVDANNNGIDDLIESTEPTPDSDRDGFPDSIDVFPNDPTEWLDTDGDGVGDNSDAFPTDPTESRDSDLDGIGDNTDIDVDNDGIENSAEAPTAILLSSWTELGEGLSSSENTLTFDFESSIFERQATSARFVDLGVTDEYSLSWVLGGYSSGAHAFTMGLGDVESSSSSSDVDYGFWIEEGGFGIIESGAFQDVWGSIVEGVTTFAIEVDGTQLQYLVDGVVQRTVTLGTPISGYFDSSFVLGQAVVSDITLAPLGGVTADSDHDNDGVDNILDLDSDNDSIPDIVEAGLVDSNGDRVVDLLSDQGSVTRVPDLDGDGIPDHLDIESLNAANDGTAYDIAMGSFAVLDSNNDGMIDASDLGGGTDANGNGVDDLIEAPDSDGDLYPDVIDAFPSDPSEWLDTDGDGVGDNSDAFPNDASESADSDGDGVGDNADAFPTDPTETLDSDLDGVGDNADVFPLDPAEVFDTDGDGTGDNADIDRDNDGLADSVEVVVPSLTSPIEQVATSGGTATQFVDLSSLGVTIGSVAEVSNIQARGDLDSTIEVFELDFNQGQVVMAGLTTTTQCSPTFQAVTPAQTQTVPVVDIGGGVPGFEVTVTLDPSVNNFCGTPAYALEYIFTVTGVVSGDADGDGIVNARDLDSDNDAIPDIIEAGLLDSDGNFLIDSAGDEGAVTVAPDSDSDGIPDYLDIESQNPLNDGTAYDIATTGFASFDTNNDGVLNSSDTGGGVDANSNGVDDLIEAPDTDGDGFPDTVDVFPNDPSEWADSDMDGVGDNSDAFPNDPTETADSDGDGVGDDADVFPADPSENADSDGDGVGDNADAFPNDATESVDTDGDGVGDNSDPDIDNDGIANEAEMSTSAELDAWPVLGEGISAVENDLVFSDGGSPFPRQANSERFSQFGYTDEYQFAWQFSGLSATHGFAFGLSDSESNEFSGDIEYGFWVEENTFGIMESGVFVDVWGAVVDGVTDFVIEVDGTELTYRVDGVALRTATLTGTPDFYVDTSFIVGSLTVSNMVIEPIGGGVVGDADTDGDGINNTHDLDSDNDSIPDIEEAGLTDADGDFMVDTQSEEASVTTAPDLDGDALPDHLDLESLNAANDGTAFDLLMGPWGSLDTNSDGQINSLDVGGGVDANMNGVDDLLE